MEENALQYQVQNDQLYWGGANTVALAEKYGTPLYLFDENKIRQGLHAYKNGIQQHLKGKGRAVYASKAFCCKEMARIVASEGMGMDVVSGGELYTVLAGGADPGLLIFHGNNKTPQELAMALESNVGLIVVDNPQELELLNTMATAMEKQQSILLRIKPGIDAHTHSFIRTGQIDSKFGFALETGEAMQAVRKALQMPALKLCGLHCHIGSQIFDTEPFALAVEVMINFMADIQNDTGTTLTQLNLGGGFGIAYLPEHRPVPVADYFAVIAKALYAACEARSFAVPEIIVEPGRSIAAPAGITLYTAGATKQIPGVRNYLSVDGGMTDNPRYALYQAPYHAILANRATAAPTGEVTLAGKCCESGDLLQENLPFPSAQPGELVAVFATGAYNYSMASNYNRICRPPVVMVKDGQDRLAIRRESYEDLIALDL